MHVTPRPSSDTAHPATKRPRWQEGLAHPQQGKANAGQSRHECAYCAAVPLDSNIRVFRSSIHGYGVMALRDLQPGETVADVEGILYRGDEIEDDRYCLWVDDDFYFDMVDQTRWINHSCDPNAEIEAELDGRGGAWARVVAMRLIRAGEEITYDYGFPQELAEPCSCRVAKCIGWIVDSEELPALAERLARESHGHPPAASSSRD